ncbi:unnamed protein product [Urochloa humidicola]
MPCADKNDWEKTNGPKVLPPVYEKKVGRPPKSRRKQPYEVQGKDGPKLSRHGVIITCSWCKGQHHNRAGCKLRKLGIKPSGQSNPDPVVDECILDDEPVITQETGHPQAADVQLEETMLSQMLKETSRTAAPYQPPGPLPDCSYIAANQLVARPVPPTTASKAVKAGLNKRKAAGTKPKDETTKKAKATGNKTVGNTTKKK